MVAKKILAVWIATVFLLGGCAGTGIDKANQVLASVQSAAAFGTRQLEQYDSAYQDDLQKRIEKTVQDKDMEALLKLEAEYNQYKAKRNTAIKVIAETQAVLALGSALIPLVERGIKKDKDLSAWLLEALQAASRLKAVLESFGIQIPLSMNQGPSGPPHNGQSYSI